MSQFDHLDLDGHGLQLLLAVHEEASVTRAAQRLGLTQSAVSHGLDRLRAITGDALFVRSGRGIVATAQAEALAQRARVLLEDLRAFSHAAGFDPARWEGTITLAANDLQRDLLLPWRTVMGNVEYGLELSGIGREERARRAATYYFARNLDKRAVELLPPLLRDGDVWVRLYAVMALKRIADVSAVPTLLTAAADPEYTVRVAAVQALA